MACNHLIPDSEVYCFYGFRRKLTALPTPAFILLLAGHFQLDIGFFTSFLKSPKTHLYSLAFSQASSNYKLSYYLTPIPLINASKKGGVLVLMRSAIGLRSSNFGLPCNTSSCWVVFR
jgi:hypothetical protein